MADVGEEAGKALKQVENPLYQDSGRIAHIFIERIYFLTLRRDFLTRFSRCMILNRQNAAIGTDGNLVFWDNLLSGRIIKLINTRSKIEYFFNVEDPK